MNDFAWSLFVGSLTVLGLSWAVGAAATRSAHLAEAARAIGAACAAATVALYFVGIHRPPPQVLLAGSVAYPLLACEPGKGWGRRALVLAGLSVLTCLELLDFLRWRRGWEFSARWRVPATIGVLAVPAVASVMGAVWGRRHEMKGGQ